MANKEEQTYGWINQPGQSIYANPQPFSAPPQALTYAEFATAVPGFYNVGAVTVTAASYTLLVTDRGKVLETLNNSGVTLTIDPTIFNAGDSGTITQVGTGQVTLVPAAGTFLSDGGLTKTTTIGAAVGWRVRSLSSIALTGDRA